MQLALNAFPHKPTSCEYHRGLSGNAPRRAANLSRSRAFRASLAASSLAREAVLSASRRAFLSSRVSGLGGTGADSGAGDGSGAAGRLIAVSTPAWTLNWAGNLLRKPLKLVRAFWRPRLTAGNTVRSVLSKSATPTW